VGGYSGTKYSTLHIAVNRASMNEGKSGGGRGMGMLYDASHLFGLRIIRYDMMMLLHKRGNLALVGVSGGSMGSCEAADSFPYIEVGGVFYIALCLSETIDHSRHARRGERASSAVVRVMAGVFYITSCCPSVMTEARFGFISNLSSVLQYQARH